MQVFLWMEGDGHKTEMVSAVFFTKNTFYGVLIRWEAEWRGK